MAIPLNKKSKIGCDITPDILQNELVVGVDTVNPVYLNKLYWRIHIYSFIGEEKYLLKFTNPQRSLDRLGSQVRVRTIGNAKRDILQFQFFCG
jgi:hypothetical protein